MKKKGNILLVEPDFPIPTKSKNHSNFLPIGLLKLATYYKNRGNEVKLVRGNQKINPFNPDRIMVTSLFTYWSKYVWETVEHYRNQFPKSKIIVGGIYATLMHNAQHFKKNLKKYGASVFVGQHRGSERCIPDYDSVDVDYQIVHGMRGCIRKCKFCGTWKIEPKQIYKTTEQIINEVKNNGKNKIIFYDNNFLANPNAKEILRSLADLRINGKPVLCEAQSGFDGRLMDLETVKLIKSARFQYPRIAWDHGYIQRKSIKKQIGLLNKAGYSRKDIFVFMIYNYDVTFEEMEKKRKLCKKWGVQIADCRYRPLWQLWDNYNPQARKGQTEKDYYIHKKAGWTDSKIRKFRKNIREQNIGIRYGGKSKEYNAELATTYSNIKRLYKKCGIKKFPTLNQIKNDKKTQKKIKFLQKRLKEMQTNKKR